MRFLTLSNPTVILGGIFVLLGAYLLLVEIPAQKKAEESEALESRIFHSDFDFIETLRLVHSETEIHLKKTGPEEWLITHPIQTRADSQEMRGFLSTLTDLRHSRLVERTASDPSEYGLANPKLELELGFAGGSETIRLGDDAPIGNSVFLGRESDGRVVTIEKWILGALTRSVFDLRTKIILPVEKERIQEMTLTFPKTKMVFINKAGQWSLDQPISDPGDPDSIDKLLLAVQNLRAGSFIDPGDEHQNLINTLKNPMVTIDLLEGEKEHQARFYKSPDPSNLYVRTRDEAPIYRVAAAASDDFPADLFHFQDKRLLFIEAEQIIRMEVQGPHENLALVREEKIWKLDGFPGKIREHLANRFADQIAELEAFEAADQSARNKMSSGLDSPGHIIRLTLGGPEQSRETVRIGNEWKGMLFAEGREALGPVMINKDFLDEIPRKADLIAAEEAPPSPEAPSGSKEDGPSD